MSESRGSQLGIHAAGDLNRLVTFLLSLGQFYGDIACTFGHAEVHRIDQREGNGGDNMASTIASVVEPLFGAADLPEMSLTSPTAAGVTHRSTNLKALG